MQTQRQVPVHLFFCNMGEYHVNLNVHVTVTNSTDRPNTPHYAPLYGHQQQLPAIDYRTSPQPHNGGRGYGLNTTYTSPQQYTRPPYTQDAGHWRKPGISSNSWQYAAPRQATTYGHQYGTNGHQSGHGQVDGRLYRTFSSDATTTSNSDFRPSSRTGDFPVTSTPTKPKCYPGRRCDIV